MITYSFQLEGNYSLHLYRNKIFRAINIRVQSTRMRKIDHDLLADLAFEL